MDRLAAVKDQLASIGQQHLLAFWSDLSSGQQASLLQQIESIDLGAIPDIVENYVTNPVPYVLPDQIEPPKWYPRDHEDPMRPYDADKFRKLGAELVRDGGVGVFCVAGGQGTRLGWDGPKGTFPATPIRKQPLFQVFAEQILAAEVKFGRAIPLYVMTSPMNHSDTVAYFNQHRYFGLNSANVYFFPQGMMPSFDVKSGHMLLADKDAMAFSPDGHGGSLQALARSGALENMEERGVKHISYIQVDNPLVKVIDPLFLGLHAFAEDSSAEMSSKMLPKTGPREKLGNFCQANGGRTTIIEYSDLPDDLAEQRDALGELRFRAGSIAIHTIGVKFVRRITDPDSKQQLPWHRAVKKVPHIDVETGKFVEPTEPNAVKVEKFVFDALPLCESSIILETDRIEEFAPIKNLEGVDSADSSREIQIERHARWLQQVGVEIPRSDDDRVNATIEISPLTATEPGDLRRLDLPEKIEFGEEVLF